MIYHISDMSLTKKDLLRIILKISKKQTYIRRRSKSDETYKRWLFLDIQRNMCIYYLKQRGHIYKPRY